MRILFSLFYFIFFTFFYAYGQNPLVVSADSLLKIGQPNKAIELYKEALKEDTTSFYLQYNMAASLALIEQKEEAFHYLDRIAKKDTSVRILLDPDFYFLVDEPEWEGIENQLVSNVEAKYGPYKNLELAKELWKMNLKDQAFYYHLNVAESSNQNGYLLSTAIWELKEKINHENVIRLEEIIRENGWPKISDVRDGAATAAFLIIQHADLDIQKKYLPLMREAADNDEAKWSSLALLIDRINLREGRKQIYGSQIGRDENGNYYVDDLGEPEYVNQRRKEVGLGPIEEYVSRWGITWDIEQKEK